MQGQAPYSIATISIKESAFVENLAPIGAGLYASVGHKTVVEDSEFDQNSVYTLRGAGAEISGAGEAEFRGCNFTRNFAWNGGAGKRDWHRAGGRGRTHLFLAVVG